MKPYQDVNISYRLKETKAFVVNLISAWIEHLFKFGNWIVRSDVSGVVSSPLCRISTVLTLQNSVTMLCWYVSQKVTLFCSLIITMSTRILDTFMYRQMFLEITPVCSLIITMMTRVLYIFMFRLNTSLKMTPLCSSIITLTTRIIV